MKKTVLYAILLLFVCNTGLMAQGNEIDAFTLTNTELGGTARSMAMGGAFGALGGDLSIISTNPAGLGIYRSSEVAGTFNLSSVGTNTDWGGTSTGLNKTNFTMNNFGFELYFPTSSESVLNWNLGFSFNRLKNYNRRYRMESNNRNYSMADYVASDASDAGIYKDELVLTDSYDPYFSSDLSGYWLPILGYESGMYDNITGHNNRYNSAFGSWQGNNTWVTDAPINSALLVEESGYMDEYNIGFGMNIANTVFVGASLTVTDISYRYNSAYEDWFDYVVNGKQDNLYLHNRLNTEGDAISANIGVITNLQMLRLGVAYSTPRYYTMTDYYNAEAGTYINGYDDPLMESETPNDSYSEYRFRTPGKWTFSAAMIFGQSALVSADYEIMNYKSMKFSDMNGYDGGYGMNDYIKEDYTMMHTLKLGAEIKATPQFAVRAGYMLQTSPMLRALVDNDVVVDPSGTIPHFTTVSKPTNYITAGVGYRFTPNFHIDLACVYRMNNSNAFAFSSTSSDGYNPVTSDPAALKTNTTNVVMTLGYKF
ncbi:MAG: outer membrane protein transport protein [Tannerella sp.]|jgi:hypothetical protein|nr:outer membrane protein transport protein [Tannerella sp.]